MVSSKENDKKPRLDECSEAEIDDEEVGANEAMLDEKKDKEKETPENPNQGILYYLMAHHLWIFAIWLIPISLVYDIFWWFRTRWTYWMCRRHATLRHDDKVTIANYSIIMSLYLFCFRLSSFTIFRGIN